MGKRSSKGGSMGSVPMRGETTDRYCSSGGMEGRQGAAAVYQSNFHA